MFKTKLFLLFLYLTSLSCFKLQSMSFGAQFATKQQAKLESPNSYAFQKPTRVDRGTSELAEQIKNLRFHPYRKPTPEEIEQTEQKIESLFRQTENFELNKKIIERDILNLIIEHAQTTYKLNKNQQQILKNKILCMLNNKKLKYQKLLPLIKKFTLKYPEEESFKKISDSILHTKNHINSQIIRYSRDNNRRQQEGAVSSLMQIDEEGRRLMPPPPLLLHRSEKQAQTSHIMHIP